MILKLYEALSQDRIESDHGYIDINPRPSFSNRPSIVNFYVDKEYRGTGEGQYLLHKAIEKYPDVQGQAGSRSGVISMYRAGMRPYEHTQATLEQTIAMFDRNESLLMVTTSFTESYITLKDLSKRDFNIPFAIQNDKGRARFSVENSGYHKTLLQIGLNPKEPVPFEDEYLVKNNYPKNDKTELHLNDWHATTSRSGFGTEVLKAMKNVAEDYDLDSFWVHMPSYTAQQVLQNFENKGWIEADKTILRGTSDAPYPIHFYFKNVPK